MIYAVAIAFAFALVGFYRRFRYEGFWTTFLDAGIASTFGWFAGLLIGVGARIGMWSIPFFNGTEPRVTTDGSFRVILVFSLAGIGLGLIYELFFRKIVGRRGWLFGLLVAVCSWYPVSAAGLQQITFEPSLIPLTFVTGAIVALMFVPYAVVLEIMLGWWHRFASGRYTVSSSDGRG